MNGNQPTATAESSNDETTDDSMVSIGLINRGIVRVAVPYARRSIQRKVLSGGLLLATAISLPILTVYLAVNGYSASGAAILSVMSILAALADNVTWYFISWLLDDPNAVY